MSKFKSLLFDISKNNSPEGVKYSTLEMSTFTRLLLVSSLLIL